MKWAAAIGCVLMLAVVAILGMGIGVGGYLYVNRSPWTGNAAAQVSLRAVDLTGERDGELIVRRLEHLGVEASVVSAGRDRLVLQVDGAADPKAAVAAVAVPFRLGIHGEATAGEAGGRTRILDTCADGPCAPILVDMPAAVTGRDVIRVEVRDGDVPAVALSFDQDGALALEGLTQRQVGKRVAIVVDDVVYSAPVVMERISEGEVHVTFADGDAKALSRFAACLSTPALSGRYAVE